MQTILAVDDTPENLDVIRATFGADYRVKVVTDGARALQVAQSEDPPDIILLDVMMPGMDGFEVCEQLKADVRTQHIPVIFVTALGDENDERRGLELGAVDYIQKPLNPPLARVRVRNHLALVDRRKELEYAVNDRTAELEHTRMQIIIRLGYAAEFKDNETGTHTLRISRYCGLIAEAAGLDSGLVDLVRKASPMHDVGKIGIPDGILLKPGKLDEAEWETMRKHPKLGADILGHHSDPLLRAAYEIALTHHEKWDGTGYPHGSVGEKIPVFGRITAIADVFDALTSERPYKKPWSVDDALRLMDEQRGKHFDPSLVDAFMQSLPEILAFKERCTDRLSVADLEF